jgi:pilus assembly protein CpaC
MVATAAPVAKSATVQGPSLPLCSGQVGAPRSLSLPAGKSTFMALSEPVSRLTVGNPDVVEARLISAKGLYLLGGRVGSTNLILQGRGGNCSVVDVSVGMDPAGVQASLAELLPEEKGIRVSSAADSLVLSGEVSSPVAADNAVAIANAYVRNSLQVGSSGGSQNEGKDNALAGGAQLKARVVNLLGVGSPQQVMLEVKVAEVSKTLLDKMGASFSANASNGWGTASILSDFLTGTAGGVLGVLKPRSYQFLLEAEKKDGLVRILAEPNVMAISGQEGSFLAGGKILIPVAQNNTGIGGSTITLEEKEFGVGVKFTPTVLADGRINLKVAPEVSELSRDGVGITSGGFFAGTTVMPLITTRRASTTVQLYDGQTFAIGGLIKNSSAANVKAFPFLGEVPVLGMLFRSTDFQSEKTELVFVVTPRLVKPLPPDYELPTDKVGEPGRNRIMFQGRIDSEPRRSPRAEASAPAAGGLDTE